MKYLDRTFCAREIKENRLRVCYLAAGTGYIVNNTSDIMAGHVNNPVICLNPGRNEVGRVRSKALTQKFKTVIELVNRKQERNPYNIILPRKGVGNE